jgi:hypothetical protein
VLWTSIVNVSNNAELRGVKLLLYSVSAFVAQESRRAVLNGQGLCIDPSQSAGWAGTEGPTSKMDSSGLVHFNFFTSDKESLPPGLPGLPLSLVLAGFQAGNGSCQAS